MQSASFFRPMFAGFAITATAILVVPMAAKAQTPEAEARCGAAPQQRHGLKLGRMLAAAQNSRVLPLMGAPGLGLAVAGAVIEAARQPRTGAKDATTFAACSADQQLGG